jgi:hypothetical protein
VEEERPQQQQQQPATIYIFFSSPKANSKYKKKKKTFGTYSKRDPTRPKSRLSVPPSSSYPLRAARLSRAAIAGKYIEEKRADTARERETPLARFAAWVFSSFSSPIVSVCPVQVQLLAKLPTRTDVFLSFSLSLSVCIGEKPENKNSDNLFKLGKNSARQIQTFTAECVYMCVCVSGGVQWCVLLLLVSLFSSHPVCLCVCFPVGFCFGRRISPNDTDSLFERKTHTQNTHAQTDIRWVF